MAEIDSYRATLDRLQRDLVQAEARTNRLREAIAAIRGLIESDNAPPRTEVARSSSPSAPRLEREPRIVHAKMEDAAVIAFEKVQSAMRVRDLYNAMMAMGYHYTKGFDVFKGSMIPTLRRKPQFTKVGTGLYQLRAWGSQARGDVPAEASD